MPYYIGDLKGDPNLEKYPHPEKSFLGLLNSGTLGTCALYLGECGNFTLPALPVTIVCGTNNKREEFAISSLSLCFRQSARPDSSYQAFNASVSSWFNVVRSRIRGQRTCNSEPEDLHTT